MLDLNFQLESVLVSLASDVRKLNKTATTAGDLAEILFLFKNKQEKEMFRLCIVKKSGEKREQQQSDLSKSRTKILASFSCQLKSHSTSLSLPFRSLNKSDYVHISIRSQPQNTKSRNLHSCAAPQNENKHRESHCARR
jgi:hypothetical protein